MGNARPARGGGFGAEPTDDATFRSQRLVAARPSGSGPTRATSPHQAPPVRAERPVDLCGPVGLVCAVLAFGLVVMPVGSVVISLPLAAAGLALGIAGIVQTGAGRSRGRGVAVAAVVVSLAVPVYVVAVVFTFVASILERLGSIDAR
jgi:hypothetical protein